MGDELPGEEILAGPRGRRLCAALAESTEFDATAVAALTDPVEALAPLADAVTFAMYWQEPDDTDRLVASDEVRATLVPIARALAAAPATSWWGTAMASDTQHYVGWADRGTPVAPRLGEAADLLREWKAAAVADDLAAAQRPDDLDAAYSGWWWSAPLGAEPPVSTSRSLGRLGAVGLLLVEDSADIADAQLWSLTPEPGARIYEITGPQAWTTLVERYPLDVTRSRRHDWYRATGRAGSWHIPDWERVAADYDGVHLTVTGYLSTAGRALEVGDSATLLGGWNPDQTFWLTDVVSSTGAVESWWNDGADSLSWSPALAD
jgi:hypothetical protein